MVPLDTRSRDVLIVLLKASTPLTIGQIATQLDLTPRRLRTSLDVVESWLAEQGMALLRKPNFGVSITAPGTAKEAMIRELYHRRDFLLYLSPAERVAILTFLLLRHPESPQLAEQFEPILGVSRPTLLKDLHKVGDWLSAHRLSLLRKPHFGFQVFGDERLWREAMVSFLIDHLGTGPLLTLCTGRELVPDDEVRSYPSRVYALLVEYAQELELGPSVELVAALERSLHRKFTDSSFVVLTCHLALAVDRTRTGNLVGSSLASLDPARAHKELVSAQRVAAEVQNRFGLELDEGEIAFLAEQILGAEVQRTVADVTWDRQSWKSSSEVREIVEEIVGEASLYLHPYLKVDQQLIRGLTFHVQVALSRLNLDLPIRNPLRSAIQVQYPHIYRTAAQSVKVIERRTGKRAPEEEIAYIAMHLGAAMERLFPFLGPKYKVWIVCGEGLATAWLLVSRLQAEIPQVEVVEVCSSLEINHKPPRADEVDAILTTVPLKLPGLRTLVVSPLLTEEDKVLIQGSLSIGARRVPTAAGIHPKAGVSLSELVDASTIRLKANAHTWQEVVEKAGAPLQAVGAIEFRYIEAMKEVILRYGPYVVFTPGVALLHARPEQGVNRLCMNLITLQTPVRFGHQHNDPVLMAIVLGVVDHSSHVPALAQLAKLVSSTEWVQQVLAASSKAEVVRLLGTGV